MKAITENQLHDFLIKGAVINYDREGGGSISENC